MFRDSHSPHRVYARIILEGMKVLDAAFNTPNIWKQPSVWNKIKNGLRTTWSKCLDRMWHPGHEGIQELSRQGATPKGGVLTLWEVPG